MKAALAATMLALAAAPVEARPAGARKTLVLGAARSDSNARIARTQQPLWTAYPPFTVTATYPTPPGKAELAGAGTALKDADGVEMRTRSYLGVGVMPYVTLQTGVEMRVRPGETQLDAKAVSVFNDIAVPLVHWGVVPFNPSLKLGGAARIGGQLDLEGRLVLCESFDTNLRLAANGIVRQERREAYTEDIREVTGAMGYAFFDGLFTPGIEGMARLAPLEPDILVGGSLLLRPRGWRLSLQAGAMLGLTHPEQAQASATLRFEF